MTENYLERPFDPDLFNRYVVNCTEQFWGIARDMVVDRPFPKDGLIYHYTSLESAISIIEKQEIWSSNIAFLNDSNELICGRNILRNIPKLDEKFFEQKSVEDLFNRLNKSLDTESSDAVFVTSFCEEGDLLSQWRGYGGGVAIAFDAQAIDECFQETHIKKIIYDAMTQAKIFSSLITSISSWLHNNNDENIEYIGMAARLLRGFFDNLSAKMKNYSFREEKEWRLLTNRFSGKKLDEPPEVFFRTRGRGVVPFIKLTPTANMLPIRGVRLGPNSHISLHATFNALLLKKGYQDFFVTPSAIPFRD